VLVLSGFPERQYAVNVLKAGASGYLSKDSAPEELMKAVTQVLSGKRYDSASLAELLVAELDTDHDKPLHSELSEREFQIPLSKTEITPYCPKIASPEPPHPVIPCQLRFPRRGSVLQERNPWVDGASAETRTEKVKLATPFRWNCHVLLEEIACGASTSA
jgi:hypothetical protein